MIVEITVVQCNFAELMGSLWVFIGTVGKEMFTPGFNKIKETGTSMDNIEYFMLTKALVYSKTFTSLTMNFILPLLGFFFKESKKSSPEIKETPLSHFVHSELVSHTGRLDNLKPLISDMKIFNFSLFHHNTSEISITSLKRPSLTRE